MEDLRNMDLEALKRLYIEKNKVLYQQILAGKDWKEVEEQKQFIASLTTELDKRLHRPSETGNPAEVSIRVQ